ncbi:MAG: DNA polymerase III subunit gamma/tau, partial [Thiohalomonadales bacterium]|nr:DNA polymerase III subunit gamma/tau [Thiohalomonadales bacterium]
TRGVGKTTIARILAKSLNCEQGVSSKPCGQCSTCREIDEGRFVDLIEVDAASRTKVDETRELLDNVQYAPTRGRYKVYLIDEVHMFSNHSFNALLKTLEEPPPHVKFLLATTDPQKLPVTILSRCLQFNLRRLPTERIEGHLGHILQAEGVECDTAALHRLARAADGSMRDALSLLDQAIAFGAGKVTEVDVQAMLGSIEQDHVFRLLENLATGNGAAVLQTVTDLAQQAPDYADVLAELITALHHLALLKVVPDAWLETMGDKARLMALAEHFSPEDMQLYYQIALTGRRDLPLAPEPRSGLEMVLLRMLAFRPVDVAVGAPTAPAPVTTQPKVANSSSQASTKSAAPAKQVAPVTECITPDAEALQTEPGANTIPTTVGNSWHQIVAGLQLGGVMQQLVAHCVLLELTDTEIHLALATSSAPLLNKEREAGLREALTVYFGRPLKLHIEIKDADGETPAEREARLQAERQATAEAAIESDPNVQSILDAFDGQVRPNSVQPIE